MPEPPFLQPCLPALRTTSAMNPDRTMKPLIATATLTLMFLSAGAFAAISHNKPKGGPLYNITVIYKTAALSN